MIKPPAFKFECPNCKYTKTVKPKSDVLNSAIDLSFCPKCNIGLEIKPMPVKSNKNWLSKLMGK